MTPNQVTCRVAQKGVWLLIYNTFLVPALSAEILLHRGAIGCQIMISTVNSVAMF